VRDRTKANHFSKSLLHSRQIWFFCRSDSRRSLEANGTFVLYLNGFAATNSVPSRRSIFASNFREVGTDDLEPVDGYAALDSDIYFENLVAAKHSRLEVRLLPAYEEILALGREVLTEVRSELGEGRT